MRERLCIKSIRVSVRVRGGGLRVFVAAIYSLGIKVLRNRIVTAAIEWVAPDDAPTAQRDAFEDAVFLNCLRRVLRAGWLKSTYPRSEARRFLIQPNDP